MSTQDSHIGNNGAPVESPLGQFIGILETLWLFRKKITKVILVITVCVAIGSFIWPKTYIAHTTILPDIDFLNGIGNLGGFKDLAAAIGLNPSQAVTSPSQLYPDILESEILLRRVVYHKFKTEKYDTLVNLIQYWRFDDKDENLNFEECAKYLRESILDITVDKKTLIISLDVSTHEPQFSADLANELVAELDFFQRNFRRTNAGDQRKFLEQRLVEIQSVLSKAEENLKDFAEKNRRIDQSPELLLQQGRLQRDVDLNSTLFIELKKQYELAKLDEIKNTPVVQILDPARPPAKKDKPKRILVTLAAFILSAMGSSTWYLVSDRLAKKSEDETMVRVKRLLSAAGSAFGALTNRKKRKIAATKEENVHLS